MSTNKTLFAALAALVFAVAGCDTGAPSLPAGVGFQGSVSGVVSAEQANLPGVAVRISGSVIRESVTSANGSFSFPNLPIGAYVVALTDYPDAVEFPVTSKSASIDGERMSARLDFNGSVKRDASIQGTVTMEGIAMQGVEISLSGSENRNGTTNAQGVVTFQPLKRGSYSVAVSGYDSALHSFPQDRQTISATTAQIAEAHFAGTLVPQPPTAPTGFSAEAGGPSTVDLSWTDASEDETRFEVERKEGSEGDWATVAAPEANATTFGDAGLNPNTTYTFRVRSCSDAGCSGYSNEASATTDDVPPMAPTALVAAATGPFSADLTWVDGSGNETRFEVERKPAVGGEWALVGTAGLDGTSLSDNGLSSATTYSYRVRACNEIGCSPYSSEASTSTDDVPPAAPGDLTASATGTTTALLGWSDESDNEAGFEVQRKEGPGGAWVARGTAAENTTGFPDTDLTPNTLYSYRVRACNPVGCSPFSAEANVTTDEIAPTAPGSLSATATGPTEVHLTWTDASSNEGRFEVERKLDTHGAWSQVVTPGPNTTEITDNGLLPNSPYTYRVRACNDVGCSPYSNQATTTTPDAPPTEPSSLGASASGPHAIDLAWTDESNNELEFRVERKEGAGGSWSQVGVVGSGVESYPDSGLTPITTHFYRVRSCNAQGCSGYSNEASATTPETLPAAPSGLGASPTGTSTIDLAWTDNADNESTFKVERKDNIFGLFSQVASLPANTTTFGDTGLSSITTYYYRVSACNSGGCSIPSNQADAKTWGLPPASPTGLGAAATGGTTVSLTWTDNAGTETGFRVERKEGAGGSYVSAGTVAANATSFSDSGLSLSTTYYYRVVAFNGSGDSAASNEDDATTWEGTGPNLTISAMYLTQSTQTLGGAVPLVADRDGFLRVFAVASETNTLQPTVRVRFYLGGSLTHTEVITAPGASVPTGINESTLGASWNVAISAALIQPNLSILADVDPTDAIAEGTELDNTFPGSGSPQAMDVRTTSTFEATFVPIRQSVNDLLGDVTAGNADQFMDVTLRMLPIAQADVALHAEYITDAPVLESDDGNGAWGTVLSEMASLRLVEGSTRYYFGVVKTTYTSGVAGMGYVGWPAAIGWDRLPSASGVAAHEWGHNWNLRHAPGCGAGSPDPSYPYAEGKTGVWGMDLWAGALKSPSTYYDFMTYCSPDWISDYHYEAILDYRQAYGDMGAPPGPEPSLLVWGRVEDGAITLEPAFEITTRPVLPAEPGEYLLEALGEDGSQIFSMPFRPAPVPDAGTGDGHFSFAIPLRLVGRSELKTLRVSAPGKAPASRISRAGPTTVAPREPGLTPVGGSAVELTWDSGSFPMALILDPETGEVVSFARGGSVRLPLASDEIEVIFSDGIRSPERMRRRVR